MKLLPTIRRIEDTHNDFRRLDDQQWGDLIDRGQAMINNKKRKVEGVISRGYQRSNCPLILIDSLGSKSEVSDRSVPVGSVWRQSCFWESYSYCYCCAIFSNTNNTQRGVHHFHYLREKQRGILFHRRLSSSIFRFSEFQGINALCLFHPGRLHLLVSSCNSSQSFIHSFIYFSAPFPVCQFSRAIRRKIFWSLSVELLVPPRLSQNCWFSALVAFSAVWLCCVLIELIWSNIFFF